MAFYRPYVSLAAAAFAVLASRAQAADAPAKPDDEVVKLQKMEVKEQAGGTEAKFAEKAATDSLVETVTGAALKNP